MTFRPEVWQRVKQVFGAALDVEPSARAAFVASACGDDAPLRRQVEAMLAAHDGAPAFLEIPAAVLLDGPPVPQDLSGDAIGPYRLVVRIGAGGMGEVYKAEDTKLDRLVAVKLVPPHLAADADRLRRFHAEARAASSLNHPHILVVHDFGQVDGRPFIVTEFVEGQTLRQRLQTGPIAAREALDIAIQIAEALTVAHARGLVHRDIKPENVMLRPDGYVKVLDFGLAKLTAPSGAETMVHTQAGVVMGTPRYMSPEQVRGHLVDARTDVWSLGAVLYEMVAGRPPFDGASSSDVLAAVLRGDPPPFDSATPLGPVIVKALAKEAPDRFESGAEMHRALTALQTRGQQRPAALVVAAAYVASRRTASPLAGRDGVLIASVANKTGDPVFDDTVRTALAVGLGQSPYLRIVSDERARETLTLMSRPADTVIAGAVAREVCQREGAKAMIDGAIAGLGSHFVITLAATDCNSGDSMARQQIEAAGKEQVLAKLGDAAGALRQTLGESLASVHAHDVPLAQATTSSLDALKAYSTAEAIRNATRAGNAEILPFLKRAIELDPTFAMAHNTLANYYDNANAPTMAAAHAARAFELRQRVTDVERLAITASYYRYGTGELDQALETYRVWKDTYPAALRRRACGRSRPGARDYCRPRRSATAGHRREQGDLAEGTSRARISRRAPGRRDRRAAGRAPV